MSAWQRLANELLDRNHARQMSPLYRFIHTFSRILFVCAFSGRSLGRRHIPQQGGMVIIANHQSFFDPILVGMGLQRGCHFMARDTLFEHPWFGRVIRSLNAFPVKRGSADVGALKESLRRLRDGAAIIAFPEATRTRDGSIGEFHPGVVLMARRAGVCILPAVLRGAYECWPRGRRWPRIHPIRVIYGQVLTPEQLSSMSQDEVMQTLRNQMLDLYNHPQLRQASTDQPV